jgi:proteic killer suppression protein
VIRSFVDLGTEKIWQGIRSRDFPDDIQRRALNRLKFLDAAGSLNDFRIPPSNRLHALTDDRAGQHSISINKKWRICFVWKDGDAHDVEIVDYH